jgi:microcystin-dependent protein
MKIRQIDIKGERYDVEAFINPIPTGAVFPFAGITAPEGFLFCDGSAVSRTTYAKLLGVIGETYGSGDGSTTFNLPDYRETVLVGAGQNEKLNIKEHDVYNIGEFKDDQMQGHWHLINGASGNAPGGGGVLYEPEQYKDIATAKKITDDGKNGTPRVGSTTHGKQTGINFIIKV